jgi:hypothetical protein
MYNCTKKMINFQCHYNSKCGYSKISITHGNSSVTSISNLKKCYVYGITGSTNGSSKFTQHQFFFCYIASYHNKCTLEEKHTNLKLVNFHLPLGESLIINTKYSYFNATYYMGYRNTFPLQPQNKPRTTAFVEGSYNNALRTSQCETTTLPTPVP